MTTLYINGFNEHNTYSQTILLLSERIVFHDVVFDRCHFIADTILERFDFVRCNFIACDLTNIAFDNGHVSFSDFKDCKLLNTSISKSYLKNVTFTRCLMKYFNGSESKYLDVTFAACNLDTSSFLRIKHTHFNLNNSNINGSSFMETDLKGLDFSNSEFTDIGISVERSKGGILRYDQAPSILAQFGVRVKM